MKAIRGRYAKERIGFCKTYTNLNSAMESKVSKKQEPAWSPSGWTPVFLSRELQADARALIGFTTRRTLDGAQQVVVVRPTMPYFGLCFVGDLPVGGVAGLWLI